MDFVKLEHVRMILKLEKSAAMTDSVKKFRKSPDDFLKNHDQNTVLVTLTQASKELNQDEFLLILATSMKVYPNCWHYVKASLNSSVYPFLCLVDRDDSENKGPNSKKRKRGKIASITLNLKAAHQSIPL